MNTPAYIWDLDGTLLDSYEAIVESVYKTYQEFHIETNKEEILQEAITTSVGDYILKTEARTGIPFEKLKTRYSEIGEEEKDKIKLIPHAQEILACLKAKGARHFVFTHRGLTTRDILTRLGIYDYFDEIVTGKDGFARKPDPSAIRYLVEKHGLDRENTYYVGDRTIDIDCACNAGIRSIMFLPEGSRARANGKETFIVKDLMEIAERSVSKRF